jgi:tRNA-splicing ligase RtcB
MPQKKDFKRINDYLWEIPKDFRPDMKVPARAYVSERMLEEVFRDDSIPQLINGCTLPGIIKYGLAMPDMHEGYSVPIGFVGAIRTSDGIISPGACGFDINCGMRLLKSGYSEKEIRPHLNALATEIQKEVPSGLGRGRQLKFDISSLNKILEGGAQRLVEQGYGEKEDLENCESDGRLSQADAATLSERAKNRGRDQVGTLGSGNHFMEVQKVERIYDEEVAKSFGLFKDQVVIMIHTGSRGLGHQVCTDYLREFIPLMERKYKIRVPDREFACVPFNSLEGQRYFAAMASAANFAWANRQMIAHYVRKAWKSVLGEKALPLVALYDVAHNIIKKEKYLIDEKETEVVVHRKGATRAFPPGHSEIPERYRETGQPVIIPGSMGTASYILVGTKEGEEAFYSTCFTGDTKLLTNKGIFTFSEIHKRFFEDKEEFLTPSFNNKTYQFEWKPITNVITRKAPVIEVEVSQTGRSKLNTLRVTPGHKFITLSGPKFIKKKLLKIIEDEEMICLADKLPGYNYQFVDPQLAYVVGSIITDGCVYPGPGNGRYPYRGRKITFIQKKTPQKLSFINFVQSSFQNVFSAPLREYRTRTGGGYIRGEIMEGIATDFVCTQAQPVQQLLFIKENLIPWVLSLSEEATFNFLAGVIDGDGTWHPHYKIIDIFSGGKKESTAIVIACLKLGILPYISKQRSNCYIIQISEKIDEITKYTKRVKSEFHIRKYGTKLFSIRQLFKEIPDVKWPFLQKIKRNSLMSKEIIEKFLFEDKENIKRMFKIGRKRYSRVAENIERIISSPLRMQRARRIRELDTQEVFNITVKDNHNYIVLTDLFLPVLVANCHGAGRTMSRHAAIRAVSGEEVVRKLESRGIIVKCWSLRGIAEEAPQAYKNIDDVVEVVHNAGLSKKVARLVPLAVIKGE